MIAPFVQSFFQADLLGKFIFIGLFALSVLTWAVILQKFLVAQKAESEAKKFSGVFRKHKSSPLNFDYAASGKFHPLFDIYDVLKTRTVELLNKNRHFIQSAQKAATLSPTDIDYIDAHVSAAITEKVQNLEKNLYILATIVTLGPFLGLLGTVWGILISFSQMQNSSSAAVLSGLALALTTTVLGLIVAIPALIGYNALKAKIQNLEGTMNSFASEVMATVELQYRQVDIYASKNS